jgi:Secretion system C-terminal sorting domain
MDDKPFAKSTYYRLKQTDVNGAFSYSKTLSVGTCTEGGQKLKIYPQPANHTLTVDNVPEQATLILRDGSGKVVLRKPTNGQTKMLLDVATIPNGIYFLQVVSERLDVTEKLIIAR